MAKRIPVELQDKEVYLCTIRDVQSARAKESVCDLFRGARQFFLDRYQIDMDALQQVDCHYPPGLLYGTLHFHFRRESTMSGEELIMRHRLADMVSLLPVAENSSGGMEMRVVPNQQYYQKEIFFEYPHHSRRAIAELIDRGLVPSFKPTSGAKSYVPTLPVVVVGAESNERDI